MWESARARYVWGREGAEDAHPRHRQRARLRLVVVPVRHRRRLLDLGARHAPRAGLDLLDLARLAARLVGVVVLVEPERDLRRRRHRLELRVGEQLVDARLSSSLSLSPSPLAAEMAMTRLWPAAAASSRRSSSFFAATSGLSSLLRTTTCGLSASSAEKSWSSVFTACRSPTGSGDEPSTMCAMSRQRSMWRRKARPRPTPSCAPSRSPGMSARTMPSPAARACSPACQTPRLGVTVVNG